MKFSKCSLGLALLAGVALVGNVHANESKHESPKEAKARQQNLWRYAGSGNLPSS